MTFGDSVGPIAYRFGPRVSIGSSSYMNTFFGINDEQSSRSGLTRYNSGGGITTFGIGGTVIIPITMSTALTVFYGYDILGPNAARSPLVEERGSEHQFTTGVAFGYRFGL